MSAFETVTPQELQSLVIAKMRGSLRLGQQALSDWQQGEMAVSAVPGAGKSHSMAVAAAITIAREKLNQRRKLIIVTLTRSAAAHIKKKIDDRLRDLGLPPTGYSVSTIHSLAWSIANSHPELSLVDTTDRTVITPQPNHKLVRTAVERWLPKNPDRYRDLLAGMGFDGEETERMRRQSAIRSDLLPNLTLVAVSEAKSSGISPTELGEIAADSPDEYHILNICAGLYEEYQNLLQEMRYLDHDEMILGALRVLQNPAARKQWQSQVYGVFEDEAQDSSPLQFRLLRLLAGGQEPQSADLNNRDNLKNSANLIRVGDPNQSINSSYTSADPTDFRDFCDQCAAGNNLASMTQAGRSAPEIIAAANYILHWGNRFLQPEATKEELGTVFWAQDIQEVEFDDPQPNPIAIDQGLEIQRPQTIFQSIEQIGERIIGLYNQNPNLSMAILVRDNRQAKFVRDKLGEMLKGRSEIKINSASSGDRASQIPQDMLHLLQFIARPHSPDNLKKALDVLLERKLIAAQDTNILAILPERFLYPHQNDPIIPPSAELAQTYCRELIGARTNLPHFQLISYLADKLEYQAMELATADKLAELVAKQTFGNNSLEASITALQETVLAERFANIEEENEESYTATGQVTILTMHKSKGLDWDVVFLPFLSEDIIPGTAWIPTSQQFLGEFNICEVARTKIRAYAHRKEMPSAIEAYNQAKFLKSAEAMRLLYVAMTRAKRLLWMAAEREAPFSWSSFDHTNSRTKLSAKAPSPAILALERWRR
jgi:DNA helicase II / ATP-dependent DNA helicase PcrA